MRIAYLVNQYPTVSHSFIRREILALERRGVEVMRIALRGWDGELVGGEDQLERERTRYVRREGAPALLLALARMLVTRPVRLLRALALAWQMGRRAERPLPMHFVYLAEACRIEPWLRAAKIQHLHVHFANNSAEIAMLVHALGGPRWSFTVHGRDLDNAPFTRLAAKIRDCVFVVAISSYGRSQLYRWVEHQHWGKVRVVHCGLELCLSCECQNVQCTGDATICLCGPAESRKRAAAADRGCAASCSAEARVLSWFWSAMANLRADIEALIVRHNLQASVRITGWIGSEQVRDEILAARALVLPSFAEGLPVVIMEAMALRRPVISTFVGGIPELVHRANTVGWCRPVTWKRFDCTRCRPVSTHPRRRARVWEKQRINACLLATAWMRKVPNLLNCFELLLKPTPRVHERRIIGRVCQARRRMRGHARQPRRCSNRRRERR